LDGPRAFRENRLMTFVNYNGRILPAETPVFPAAHRGFRYGDGLFETMRGQEGRIPFLALHIQRLRSGMQALGMEIPPHFDSAFFEAEIQKILPPTPLARIRLSVFRKSGGLYAPENDEVEFLIEAAPFSQPAPAIPVSGILPNAVISPGPLSRYKTASSLPYVLASRERKALGWEEGVIRNGAGRVADGCHSNVFVVADGVIRTPPNEEGAIEGVARSMILKWAVNLIIAPITPSDLEIATEVFFSNALSGIRYVEIFENREMRYLYAGQFSKLWEEACKKY
jgi:branched-chain amino acid aminotransferase